MPVTHEKRVRFLLFYFFWVIKRDFFEISGFVSVPFRATDQSLYISLRVAFFYYQLYWPPYLELTHVVIHSENALVKIQDAIR